MTTLALRNRNMIDSLFNDVFDDFFTGNTLTRPYMAPTNKTAQVINRDEDWQIVFAVPGVKIKADHEDGILSITVPKPENKKRVTRIIDIS